MATNAALAALDRIWGALVPMGYPVAVMGGIALAAWNHVRATRDVDLLIAVNRNQIGPILSTLASHGCRAKKSPPLMAIGDHSFVQLLYTPPGEFYDVQIDLMLAESEFLQSALAHRVQRDVPGVRIPVDVVRCDDLILMKLVAGRIIDRADAAALLRENREVIDFDYLCAWVSRLHLAPEFTEIWREAFPDEDPPPADPA